jgi:hypothetical protein
MTGRRRLITMFAPVTFICLALSGAARAETPAASDREATRHWAIARYIELQAIAKVRPAGASAAERFVDGVAATCPNVLRNAPAESQEGNLVQELFKDVELISEAPTHEAAQRFVDAVRPLRWSSRALDHIASLAAEAQLHPFELVPTDFCADAEYWRTNGRRLAPATKAFLGELAHTAVGEPGLIERTIIQLRLLGTRAEKRLLRRIRDTEFRQRSDPPLAAVFQRLPAVVGGIEFATPDASHQANRGVN